MKEWVRWLIILPLVFLGMLTGIWFAYPWLNPDAANQVEEELELFAGSETEETIVIDNEESLDEDSESDRVFSREEQIERELQFLAQIDSLEEENQRLMEEVQRMEAEVESSADESVVATVDEDSVDSAGEAFQERIKSLLNLDEREMGPILDRLNQDQLIRIYKEAGNMQREKILRSLSTDRSAQLITEVM